MTQKILVADDSITIQKVIGLTFANENFELEMADNGDEALAKALANRPDLVIADTNMPGLSGYDLCARLRANPDLASVPLILLAGTYEVFDDERAREVGANDHLTKPFESQALIGKVRALLAATGGAPAPVADTEAELLDAEILEDDDVLSVEAEPATIETTAVEPASVPAPVEDLDFGDVAKVEMEAGQEPPQQQTSPDGGWDLGGFDDYTAGEADTGGADVLEPASEPSVTLDAAADYPEPEYEADEIATPDAAQIEELPAAEAETPQWTASAAEEADIVWDEPEVQEIEPEIAAPAEHAVAEFAETDDFDTPIAAPLPVAPAPDDLAWDDTMEAADVIADTAADFTEEELPVEADAADPFTQFAQTHADVVPAPASDDIEDVYAAFSAQVPVQESPEPAVEEPVLADPLSEAPAGDAMDDVMDDADLEPTDTDDAELPPYDAVATVVDLVGHDEAEPATTEEEFAASTQPDWNAPAWQTEEHSDDQEDEFVPASAAPVWAEESAPAAPTPQIDLSATSERLVDEARQQITDRLAASLGSELGPLVESKVTAALDDLLPRLIETRLKAAVDQALAQALDDLKRRLG